MFNRSCCEHAIPFLGVCKSTGVVPGYRGFGRKSHTLGVERKCYAPSMLVTSRDESPAVILCILSVDMVASLKAPPPGSRTLVSASLAPTPAEPRVMAVALDVGQEVLHNGRGNDVANVFGPRHVLERHAHHLVVPKGGTPAIAGIWLAE